MVCFKKLTMINNVFMSQYHYSFFTSETIVKSTDIDIFRFFVFSYFLFSLKVYLASILFSFMQYWATNNIHSWKNKFFFQLLPAASVELIFYRIGPLGFIGIRLPVLRKSVCCVCYWFHTEAGLSLTSGINTFYH